MVTLLVASLVVIGLFQAALLALVVWQMNWLAGFAASGRGPLSRGPRGDLRETGTEPSDIDEYLRGLLRPEEVEADQ